MACRLLAVSLIGGSSFFEHGTMIVSKTSERNVRVALSTEHDTMEREKQHEVPGSSRQTMNLVPIRTKAGVENEDWLLNAPYKN